MPLGCFGKKKGTDEEFNKKGLDSLSKRDLKKNKLIAEKSIKETKLSNELEVTLNQEVKENQNIKKEFASTSSQTIMIDSFPILPNNSEELKISKENLVIENVDINDEYGNYVKFDHGIPKVIRTTSKDQTIFQKHFLFEWDDQKGCYVLNQSPLTEDKQTSSKTIESSPRNADLYEHKAFESFLKELTDVTLFNMREKCEEMLSDRRINAEIQTGIRNVLVSHISRDKNVDQKTICDSLKRLQLDDVMCKEIKNVARDLIIARLVQEDRYFPNKSNLYNNSDDQAKQYSTKSVLKKPSTNKKKAQKFAVEIPENVDTSKDIILDIFFKKKSRKKKKVTF